MFELVCCSKASPSLTMDDIRAILDTANQFNDAHDITGCLLYYNNEFVQLLEATKQRCLTFTKTSNVINDILTCCCLERRKGKETFRQLEHGFSGSK